MSGRVRRRPAADDDLVDRGRYLMAEAGPDVAVRFLTEAKATFERLAAMPEMGWPWRSAVRRLAGVRVFPIHGFRNYLVFYRPLEDQRGIEVLHVFSGVRDIEALLDERDDENGR